MACASQHILGHDIVYYATTQNKSKSIRVPGRYSNATSDKSKWIGFAFCTTTTYFCQYESSTPTSTENFNFIANCNHTDGTTNCNHTDGTTNLTGTNIGTDDFATTPALAAMNEYSSYTAPGTSTPLALSYNARGDLTCDGNFNYTYDDEDRMMSAESVVPGTKLTFTYDNQNRRTSETVWSGYNTVTMTYATSTTTTFAYDGDEMIAEFDANDGVSAGVAGEDG